MSLKNGETTSDEIITKSQSQDTLENSAFTEKHQKTRQILAWIAIAVIIVSIIVACVCMVAGNINVGMAAFFCLVVVPIMMYFFIMVYDRVHKDDKTTNELLEAMEEQNGETEE